MIIKKLKFFKKKILTIIFFSNILHASEITKNFRISNESRRAIIKIIRYDFKHKYLIKTLRPKESCYIPCGLCYLIQAILKEKCIAEFIAAEGSDSFLVSSRESVFKKNLILKDQKNNFKWYLLNS